MPREGAAEGAAPMADFLIRHGVPREGRILDVPCGIGRRALGLAEHGFRVVAVDANAVEIEGAKARVPAAVRQALRYETVPAPEWPGLPAGERFDAILCFDHALYRTPDPTGGGLLPRLRDRLAPGGVLLLELLHRDFFETHPRPFAFHVLGALEQHEFRELDPETGELTLRWTFYERAGENLRHRMDSSAAYSLPTPAQVRERLAAADLRTEQVLGGSGDEPVSADRRKLLFVARAAAHG